MANANRLFLWFLGALLVGGVLWYGYWFATHFERQTRQVRSDISPEARKNPFLAAEEFLRRSNQAVASERVRDIFSLQPGTRDTIFLGNYSRLFIERNQERLLEWVEQGGHLIFVAYERDEEDAPSPLLDELGVELVPLEEEEDVELHCEDSIEPCTRPADDEEDTASPDEEPRVTVSFESSDPGEFRAAFLADRYLYDVEELAEVVVGDEVMPNLLRYSLGDGSVTVLSDNELFQNERIGEQDHAYLFSKLVGSDGKVWLFYSAEMPSLLEQLWLRAPYLLLLTALLLLMAGWHQLLRSGPHLTARYEGRRNLLENLDASAAFSWRIDRARALLRDNRDSVEQAWRRRHPQLNTLDQQQRCAWIGEKSGLAARAIERTLYGELEAEQDFIRASSVLQQLAAQVTPAAGRRR